MWLLGDKVNPEARRSPGSSTFHKLFPRARCLPISRKPDSKHVLLCLRNPALIIVGALVIAWWFLSVAQNFSKEVAILPRDFRLSCPHLGGASSEQSF